MAEKPLFRDYLARLTAVAAQGDACEECMHVGGQPGKNDWQVCHKWLKDRKDRTLTLDNIRTYCRITTALSKTIEIQAVVNELYPAVEKKLLQSTADQERRAQRRRSPESDRE